jgi:outer membrane beta-barrel protein
MRVLTQKLLIIPFLLATLFAANVYAASDIELPPEELAKETVLPVFDRVEMVRARRVKTDGKWEVGGTFSWAMSEPIFNTTKYGISAYKHTDEQNAWGLQYFSYSTGLSDYAKQLHKKYGLDYNRAPKPQYGFFGDYNLQLFYGKMSISKNTTINTHLLALLSLGETQWENKAYPGMTMGVGYKFYFTPTFSLRTDLRLFISEAPTPFKTNSLKDGSAGTTADPIPSKNSFKDRITYTNLLDISLNWLF